MNESTEYRGQPSPYHHRPSENAVWPDNDKVPQFDPLITSIKEQAQNHASRHVSNTKEMIARHKDEIKRLQGILKDYEDAVAILESTLPSEDPIKLGSLSVTGE